MKKTETKKTNEKMQLSKFVEITCKNNDLAHSYLILRGRFPIKWSQVKEKWILYNN